MRTVGVYTRSMALSSRLANPACMRNTKPMMPLGSPFTCERWAGSTSRHSTRLSISTVMTIIGMFLKNSPIVPGTSSIGVNAITVVRIAKTTGTATSRTPAIAARIGESPSLRCL